MEIPERFLSDVSSELDSFRVNTFLSVRIRNRRKYFLPIDAFDLSAQETKKKKTKKDANERNKPTEGNKIGEKENSSSVGQQTDCLETNTKDATEDTLAVVCNYPPKLITLDTKIPSADDKSQRIKEEDKTVESMHPDAEEDAVGIDDDVSLPKSVVENTLQTLQCKRQKIKLLLHKNTDLQKQLKYQTALLLTGRNLIFKGRSVTELIQSTLLEQKNYILSMKDKTKTCLIDFQNEIRRSIQESYSENNRFYQQLQELHEREIRHLKCEMEQRELEYEEKLATYRENMNAMSKKKQRNGSLLPSQMPQDGMMGADCSGRNSNNIAIDVKKHCPCVAKHSDTKKKLKLPNVFRRCFSKDDSDVVLSIEQSLCPCAVENQGLMQERDDICIENNRLRMELKDALEECSNAISKEQRLKFELEDSKTMNEFQQRQIEFYKDSIQRLYQCPREPIFDNATDEWNGIHEMRIINPPWTCDQFIDHLFQRAHLTFVDKGFEEFISVFENESINDSLNVIVRTSQLLQKKVDRIGKIIFNPNGLLRKEDHHLKTGRVCDVRNKQSIGVFAKKQSLVCNTGIDKRNVKHKYMKGSNTYTRQEENLHNNNASSSKVETLSSNHLTIAERQKLVVTKLEQTMEELMKQKECCMVNALDDETTVSWKPVSCNDTQNHHDVEMINGENIAKGKENSAKIDAKATNGDENNASTSAKAKTVADAISGLDNIMEMLSNEQQRFKFNQKAGQMPLESKDEKHSGSLEDHDVDIVNCKAMDDLLTQTPNEDESVNVPDTKLHEQNFAENETLMLVVDENSQSTSAKSVVDAIAGLDNVMKMLCLESKKLNSTIQSKQQHEGEADKSLPHSLTEQPILPCDNETYVKNTKSKTDTCIEKVDSRNNMPCEDTLCQSIIDQQVKESQHEIEQLTSKGHQLMDEIVYLKDVTNKLTECHLKSSCDKDTFSRRSEIQHLTKEELVNEFEKLKIENELLKKKLPENISVERYAETASNDSNICSGHQSMTSAVVEVPKRCIAKHRHNASTEDDKHGVICQEAKRKVQRTRKRKIRSSACNKYFRSRLV